MVLFVATAGGTAAFNFWVQGLKTLGSWSFWFTPVVVGLAAWLINVLLVFRSRYLKTNYLLGWFWFCLLLATHPKGIGLAEVTTSIGFAIWLAMAYELNDDRKVGLVSRSNLGLYSALLGLLQPAWWSLMVVAVIALRAGQLRQPTHHYLQIVAGWLIGFGLVATWSAYSGTLPVFWTAFLSAWKQPFRWEWPHAGQLVVGFWLLLAVFETLRALSFAKKAKRRGLLIGWMGILWALILNPWLGDVAMPGAILAVFAAPHMVNLQAYFKRPWITRMLDISMLAVAFGAALLSA
ncbi:MAG: hypothetical protein RL168_481 [Bacteroidota bacterium]